MLYIDYREKALLSRLKAETKNMILGDISIEKDGKEIVIIERKTVSDLASSICDGRYQEQSFRLLESSLAPHRIVYLIEGEVMDLSIPKKTIQSAMMSLWFSKGFSVVQTKNIDETVEFIQSLLEKVNKESEEKEYVSTLKIKKKDKLTPETVEIMMLSQIPSVSTVTAKALLHEYGSVFQLTQKLKESRCLESFVYGDKKRKLSKKTIDTLYKFLQV